MSGYEYDESMEHAAASVSRANAGRKLCWAVGAGLLGAALPVSGAWAQVPPVPEITPVPELGPVPERAPEKQRPKAEAVLAPMAAAALDAKAPLSAKLDELVAKLASEDPVAREAADQELSMTDVKLRDVEAVLKRPGLSVEQVMRLSGHAYARFSSEPRGAMGVQFGDVGVVQGVTPGFPAFGLLQPDDRIISIDGVAVRAERNDFNGFSGLGNIRPMIIAHDPGGSALLDVDRRGRRLELRVPLGSFVDLGQGVLISETEMRQAWRMRLGRLRPELAPTQPEPVRGPRGDQFGDGSDALTADGNAVALAMSGQRASLVAGGVPRGGRRLTEVFENVGQGQGRGAGGGMGGAAMRRQVGMVPGGAVMQGGMIVNIGPGGVAIGGARMVLGPAPVLPLQNFIDLTAPVAERLAMLRSVRQMYQGQSVTERMIQRDQWTDPDRRRLAGDAIRQLTAEIGKIDAMVAELVRRDGVRGAENVPGGPQAPEEGGGPEVVPGPGKRKPVIDLPEQP